MKEKADWPSTSHSPRDHDTSHTKTVRSLLVSRLTNNNFPPPLILLAPIRGYINAKAWLLLLFIFKFSVSFVNRFKYC